MERRPSLSSAHLNLQRAFECLTVILDSGNVSLSDAIFLMEEVRAAKLKIREVLQENPIT